MLSSLLRRADAVNTAFTICPAHQAIHHAVESTPNFQELSLNAAFSIGPAVFWAGTSCLLENSAGVKSVAGFRLVLFTDVLNNQAEGGSSRSCDADFRSHLGVIHLHSSVVSEKLHITRHSSAGPMSLRL